MQETQEEISNSEVKEAKKNANLTRIFSLIDKDRIEKIGAIITMISTIVSGIYLIINYIYSENYKIECQNFYNIPSEYFTASINYKILYLFLLILCLISIISPIVLKNISEKKEQSKRFKTLYISFLLIVMGMMLGVLNIMNLVTLLQKAESSISILNTIVNWMNNHVYTVTGIIIFMAIITLFYFSFGKEINKINSKLVKRILSIVFYFSFVPSVSLFLIATPIKLQSNIRDKVKYETLIANGKNMVVLSTINEKFLVAEYQRDTEGKVEFLTDNYMFVDMDNTNISYQQLGPNPKIISSK